MPSLPAQVRGGNPSKSDPRIAEGDCFSNVLLWLNYTGLSLRLLEVAVGGRDWDSVKQLASKVAAYHGAAYVALGFASMIHQRRC